MLANSSIKIGQEQARFATDFGVTLGDLDFGTSPRI
jgi:hypothetical protein